MNNPNAFLQCWHYFTFHQTVKIRLANEFVVLAVISLPQDKRHILPIKQTNHVAFVPTRECKSYSLVCGQKG